MLKKATFLFLLYAIFFPIQSFADEILWSPLIGTSSSQFLRVGDNLNTRTFFVTFDCEKLGWGNVTRIEYEAVTLAGTSVHLVRANGQKPQYTTNVSTSQAVASTTWAVSPYCGDSQHRFMTFHWVWNSGAQVTNFPQDAVTGSGSDEQKGVQVIYAGATQSGVGGAFPPAMYVYGNRSTSTPAAGGGTTTVVNVSTSGMDGIQLAITALGSLIALLMTIQILYGFFTTKP